MKKIEKEFEQIAAFIRARRNGAIGFLNYAAVSTYWTVGAYISARVKSKTWGMGSVLALCDYLKTRHPKIRGFGQRQIYNMVEFYDTFSSAEFDQIHSRLKLDDFIVGYIPPAGGFEILQSPTAKRKDAEWRRAENEQSSKERMSHLSLRRRGRGIRSSTSRRSWRLPTDASFVALQSIRSTV